MGRPWSMYHAPARSTIQAAISEASHPEHPGDIRRRLGNSPARSRRQRVDRLSPVIWWHSGSRIIRSAMCAGEVLTSSLCRVGGTARRARFGLSIVSVSMCVSRQCTTHQTWVPRSSGAHGVILDYRVGITPHLGRLKAMPLISIDCLLP